ncbi:MAG: 16S rRNA (guanine(966)-N(2))-methyltransferase RsmD [Phascolarctobacterium sp.]|jgi:RNA methyltransferase, rsmD family
MRIITGKARGLQLTVPKTYDVRPTADRVKESVFNIIGSKIIGARVLDLFAGTGNLGLESWSRGAGSITFIDESKESLRLVKSNITKCRADADCQMIKGSAPQVAERLAIQGEYFDFAFCDPPYNKGWVQQIIAVLGKKSFLNDGGYLVVERSAHDELPKLPANCELVRSNRYGETIVDFILVSISVDL